MKKILLIFLSFITVTAFSQQRALISKELQNKGVKSKFIKPTDQVVYLNQTVNPYTTFKFDGDETLIGETTYDLQSNSIYGERAYMADNGDMSVVWTMGFEDDAFPDRGTGYQFFDGSSWLDVPTERIEDVRTGWPSIAEIGDGGEIIVSHDFGTTKRLIFNQRDTRGQGDWNVSELLPPTGAEGLVWPRIGVSGPDNDIVHVLANTYSEYEGQPAGALYSRSSDGGETWDINNIILEGTGADYYEAIYADDYKIVTEGNTVIILFSSNWIDLFYLRSDDNGDTWEKFVVWDNPYSDIPLEQVVMTDTLYCPDNSLTADIDNNGKLHLAFGLTRTLKVEEGDSYTWFPWVDGIVYWNEDMEPFTAEVQDEALSPDNLEENVTLVAWTPDVGNDGEYIWGSADFPQDYRQMGVSTMPSLHIDDEGKMFLLYATTTESLLYAGDELNYKHIWGRGYSYGNWSNELTHVTTQFIHAWHECTMPWIIGTRDGNLHMFYHYDNVPGLALDEIHPYNENYVQYSVLTYDEFGIGVENPQVETSFEVSSFPNPATVDVTIEINSSISGDAEISVVNVIGQTVYMEKKHVNPGNNRVIVDVRNLKSGVYFYTVKVGGKNVSKKMIVK